jgi:hypothetical protein
VLSLIFVALGFGTSLSTRAASAPELLVDTGPASTNTIGGSSLFSKGSTGCSPQPSCGNSFQFLGGQFTLTSAAALDSVEGWMGGFSGGSVEVKIRADNNGLPGIVIFSRTYTVGAQSVGWAHFSNYNTIIAAGTYWLTFEPVENTNFESVMPVGAPNPLQKYAFFSNGNNRWISLPQARTLGMRIYGTRSAIPAFGTAGRVIREGEFTASDILRGGVGELKTRLFAGSSDGNQAARATIIENGMTVGTWSTSENGLARAIAFRTFQNNTNQTKTFKLKAVLHGRFDEAWFGLPNGRLYMGAAVRIFDADVFSDRLNASGVSAGEFLLGSYGLAPDLIPTRFSKLPELFPGGVLANVETFMSNGPFEQPITVQVETGFVTVAPQETFVVMFDLSTASAAEGNTRCHQAICQPVGVGSVNFHDSLSPAPDFFVGTDGNPVTGIEALGPSEVPPAPATTLTLTPGTSNTPIGTTHTLTALATTAQGVPVADAVVRFEVISGPAAGLSGGAVTGADGRASFTYPGIGGVGTDNIRAYLGGLESNVVQKVWHQATTSTSVTSSVNPSDLGQDVTFTATVTSSVLTPSGTVTFKDGTNTLGTAALDASGVAILTVNSLTTGTHTITAEYTATTNFLASVGTLNGGQVVKSAPTLTVNDVSITEGDSGTKDAVFSVHLSAASNLTVAVNYNTTNGSAASPDDYQTAIGTLSFSPGETDKTINVQVNGDTVFESDETLTVNLSIPINATFVKSQGIGTIVNDDPAGGTLRFSQPTYAVQESATGVSITVERTSGVMQAATVDYATSNVTASSRSDYTSAFGTLSFAAGETTKTFTVLINEDSHVESLESLQLTLSNPTGDAVIGQPSSATLEITDDVPETVPNTNDDSEEFVRQHYHDFLNREPDASGLSFWTNQIEECGANVQCREIRRINVSAAFFLSIEFQETGYLIYKTYKAAFGDIPNTPVPLTLNEFLRDTQQVSRGVIIGQAEAETLLEQNKRAFFNSFVQRIRFTTQYPSTLTPAHFIDALNANTGASLSQAERDALVSELTANDTVHGRASVLRKITENGEFIGREKKPAFVLMQYFGYLRRNPPDAPELNLDFQGYNFWLGKLNSFNGNYIDAEMVKAFITSGEYRQRFGQ